MAKVHVSNSPGAPQKLEGNSDWTESFPRIRIENRGRTNASSRFNSNKSCALTSRIYFSFRRQNITFLENKLCTQTDVKVSNRK